MKIEIPFDLMDDIKEGAVDIADQTIDLSEIEDAYDEDLEQTATDGDIDNENTSAPDQMPSDQPEPVA
jgi:hypothetical protein